VNSPLNIPYVVREMSKILQIDEEKLADQLYKNAVKLFLGQVTKSVG
jgi:Tat protein secretion system quality control protein TatD with DNase activity